ncbi:MAG TPA: hypothetical protein VEV85_27780, partial [Bryobacteraceae bacterium]|nr:hypothetical protein [Bryobacteraceae bacterium]
MRLRLTTSEIRFIPFSSTKRNCAAATPLQRTSIRKEWFAGMHSNVGYPDDGLSYVTLDWMMQQAEAKPQHPGLIFKAEDRDAAHAGAVALDKLYDS